MNSGIKLICPCCHFEEGLSHQAFFACPNSSDGGQHILQKELSPDQLAGSGNLSASEANPYLKFKRHFFSWHLSRYLGLDYESTVNRIQHELTDTTGKGFEFTPLSREPGLMNAVGLSADLWVKNETVQPAGSHKIRHMMGSMLYLENFYRTGKKPELAIYSCGNAALAAAAMARAGGYSLRVFLPEGVSPPVEQAIARYGAEVIRCSRHPGLTGDPSYHAFIKAVADGFIPFSCSGPDNWSNIEGGQTLMLEILDQLNDELPDSMYIQVGGGALASSAIQTLFEHMASGHVKVLPRIHVVQTRSCFPVIRTYFALLKTLARALDLSITEFALDTSSIEAYADHKIDEIHGLAARIQQDFESDAVQKILHDAMLSHRWNRVWENTPHSLAHGILDDFTYDWYTLIRGMFQSGGWPVIVSEDDIRRAHTLAGEHTDIPVDPTGTSGLAGLLHMKAVFKQNGSALVLFTGRDRSIS